jgi:putative DNA primase/helicase
MRYVHDWGKWLIYDGRRWAIDTSGQVERFAKLTLDSLNEEVQAIPDSRIRDEAASFVQRSQTCAAISAMLDLATSEPDVYVRPDELDRDPWLLNVKNGTVDLRTGRLRNHDRYDLITKLAPVAFDAKAVAPTWDSYLYRVMAGNQNLIAYLRRAAGYSATGLTSERVMFLPYGNGRNGKSVFLETLDDLFGDYGMHTDPETLLVKRYGGIPNDIARLQGARFVASSETEQGRRFAEAKVKAITGGDTLTARFMRGEFFEFRPEFKIWLATNHLPNVRGTDPAIWDRIHPIPFLVRIPKEEEDKELRTKLQAELGGILRWVVEGAVEWHVKGGLEPPKEVLDAVSAYRGRMDVLGNFLSDRTGVASSAKVLLRDFYAVYKQWCEQYGEWVVAARDLTPLLVERGYEVRPSTGNKTYVFGLRLKTPIAVPQE